MTTTSPDIPAAETGDTDMTRAAQNWKLMRAALHEHIRRRALALERLSPDRPMVETVQTELAAIGDDASRLWQLSERLDRALDLAFAPRARRVGNTRPNGPAAPASLHAEFRVPA